MRVINRAIIFFNQRQYLWYLLLFALAFSLFAYLQLDPTFADPDSFYHAKMAQVLRDQGVVTEFPWLSATTLRYDYTDHHLLYHILLIPFVSILPPLVGLKLATIFFASLFVVLFFWLLRSLKVKGALWYALFLLTVNPFIFRLNLAKAQAVVLILLFLALYFLFNRRYLSLLFASWLYVWLYAGWPLLLVLSSVYLLVNWFIYQRQGGWLIIQRIRHKANGQSLFLLFSVILGLAAGVFFSPYFPRNLYFYWQQTFKIALVNYQSVIGVGGEWYPFSFSQLLLGALPFFIVFIAALTLFIYYRKKQTVYSWTFLIFSLLFFILTLKSRRNIEYFVPFALVFSGLVITNLSVWPAKFLAKLKLVNLSWALPLILFLLFSSIFIRDLMLVKDSYRQGFSFTKFSQPANWLKENTPPGSIVFHSDWDEFPLLFYHNSHNRYLVGLDPTFMYTYDQDLHQSWVEITTGKSNQNLQPMIKNVFGADYVFVDFNSNAEFDRNLANNIFFQKVFENQEARVYKVIE
ncbi:MAG: hypothetical protein A2744_00615 [Candidatus Buchananbacteria bacterium RIFCSPHIGHO2_01_FULL_44_11]|uniref:Glycosyltransferase RgtA/B/C/D-like domain-containing protein n=1 Tax=Candidatus Buchananbacteria bacterium RIFCSPHIGHO2_01_FULL_44_11 TaxID=1797535 RepID=A0A1G1Y035_9BACT|nr:MAG: hypothetical protein A2744_00615 [Candidatus Buchananbacteria bacterium RIFCSPHIGHO2_01_FULL_44_11]